MGGLRARVEKGRLVLDEPTTLPEGTLVDLVVDDEGDDLTDDEDERCTRRCPRPGNQLRLASCVQYRQFSTNCGSAGRTRRVPSGGLQSLRVAYVVSSMGGASCGRRSLATQLLPGPSSQGTRKPSSINSKRRSGFGL